MKKNMKKNNKGFSLVELIVVVLIMGIIAVALAPQVMKWVGQARTNSDASQKSSIKSSIQVALADYQNQGGSIPALSGVNFSKNDLQTAASGLAAVIDEVVGGEYPTPAAGGNFTITIDSTTGQVTVGP